ncbi:MAG: hypothetical protein AAGB13_13910 [Cyanobacteria bacterium P01_F01_bin.33]
MTIATNANANNKSDNEILRVFLTEFVEVFVTGRIVKACKFLTRKKKFCKKAIPLATIIPDIFFESSPEQQPKFGDDKATLVRKREALSRYIGRSFEAQRLISRAAAEITANDPGIVEELTRLGETPKEIRRYLEHQIGRREIHPGRYDHIENKHLARLREFNMSVEEWQISKNLGYVLDNLYRLEALSNWIEENHHNFDRDIVNFVNRFSSESSQNAHNLRIIENDLLSGRPMNFSLEDFEYHADYTLYNMTYVESIVVVIANNFRWMDVNAKRVLCNKFARVRGEIKSRKYTDLVNETVSETCRS